MFDWKYGENDYQNYYDVTVDGTYLLVFANKVQPNLWMGMVDNHMILNKTAMEKDIARKVKNKLSMNTTYIFLSSDTPEYMMSKVEECFKNHKTEIYQ